MKPVQNAKRQRAPRRAKPPRSRRRGKRRPAPLPPAEFAALIRAAARDAFGVDLPENYGHEYE
jgi:hypothetical protein